MKPAFILCPRCKRRVSARQHTCSPSRSKHAVADEHRRSDKLLDQAKDAAAEILAYESSSTPLDPPEHSGGSDDSGGCDPGGGGDFGGGGASGDW